MKRFCMVVMVAACMLAFWVIHVRAEGLPMLGESRADIISNQGENYFGIENAIMYNDRTIFGEKCSISYHFSNDYLSVYMITFGADISKEPAKYFESLKLEIAKSFGDPVYYESGPSDLTEVENFDISIDGSYFCYYWLNPKDKSVIELRLENHSPISDMDVARTYVGITGFADYGFTGKAVTISDTPKEQSGDQQIYNENGINISLIDIKYAELGGDPYYKLGLLVTNKTGKDICIDIGSIYVNGYYVNTVFNGYQPLKNNMSILTSTIDRWIIPIDTLFEYKIDTIDVVNVDLDIYENGENTPYLTVPLEINTSKNVSRYE